MKFDEARAETVGQYLEHAMKSSLTWAEKLALGLSVLAGSRDRGEGATKTEVGDVLRHGLDKLVEKKILARAEDGTLTLAQPEAPKQPMKVDAETPAEDAAADEEADRPEVA